MESQIKSTRDLEDTRPARPAVVAVIVLVFLLSLWAIHITNASKAAPTRVTTSLTPGPAAFWMKVPITLSAQPHTAAFEYPITGRMTFSVYPSGTPLWTAPAATRATCTYDSAHLANGGYTYAVEYYGDLHHGSSHAIGVFAFYASSSLTRRTPGQAPRPCPPRQFPQQGK